MKTDSSLITDLIQLFMHEVWPMRRTHRIGCALVTFVMLFCLQVSTLGDSETNGEFICVGNMCFPAEAVPAQEASPAESVTSDGVICVGNMCFPADIASADGATNGVTDTGYVIVASADGYMTRDPFLAFLRSAAATGGHAEQATFAQAPLAFLARRGWILTLLLIFLAGMALNLTPCVLPMIPVQLAILGIGHGGDTPRTKREGFVRGVIYGASMAVSYGILGALVVRSGGFFGTLQSSPWFNLSIAALFVLLALALFDVIYIDFSRFGRYSGKSAGLVAVFATGALDALLAGSCVAPALLAVLVLAGTLYAEGHTAAILLPFVLGLGMGFPWPFIATGLAAVPKPGAWMKRVKWVFGVIVVLLAVYFANLASVGFKPKAREGSLDFSTSVDVRDLRDRLASLDLAEKPVLLDFWATWCRNCSAMERVTFHDSNVAQMLRHDFTLVRVQAENPADPETAAVLREFNVIGVPAFRVLRAK